MNLVSSRLHFTRLKNTGWKMLKDLLKLNQLLKCHHQCTLRCTFRHTCKSIRSVTLSESWITGAPKPVNQWWGKETTILPSLTIDFTIDSQWCTWIQRFSPSQLTSFPCCYTVGPLWCTLVSHSGTVAQVYTTVGLFTLRPTMRAKD